MRSIDSGFASRFGPLVTGFVVWVCAANAAAAELEAYAAASGAAGPVEDIAIFGTASAGTTGSYTGFGQMRGGEASAHATFGTLGVMTSAYGTNAIGTAGATARFTDTLTLTAPGITAGQTALLSFEVKVDGNLTADNGVANWALQYQVANSPWAALASGQVFQGAGGAGQSGDPYGGIYNSGPSLFHFDQSFFLQMQLSVNTTAGTSTGSGSAFAHFGNTLVWKGFVNVEDAVTHVPITDILVSSQSGTDWAQPAVVPLPASMLLLLSSFVGLYRVRGRNRVLMIGSEVSSASRADFLSAFSSLVPVPGAGWLSGSGLLDPTRVAQYKVRMRTGVFSVQKARGRCLRSAVAAAVTLLILPRTSFALAELEVTEYSRNSPGATATNGYFHLGDPDLVSHSETVTEVGDGSGDVLSEFRYLYRDNERVNAGRNEGLLVIGALEPGHSVAKATGYADAGSNALGGYTNLGALAYVYAGDYSSTAAAIAKAKIELSFVVDAGESGAAPGDLIAGLRWEFDTHGNLSAHGMTYPRTTYSTASMDFGATMLRGPTGMCGAFDCPRGAIAAAVSLKTGLLGQSLNPSSPGDPTGSVRVNNQTWSASNNTGAFKAGGVFDSGGRYDVLLSSSIQENDSLADGIGINTGAPPLDLDYIDFDATVGETLKLTATLTAAASLAGLGDADADLFGTFSTRVFDPLGRGYDIRFSVAPVPLPGAHWVFGPALAVLIGTLKRNRAAARLAVLDTIHSANRSVRPG